VKLWEWQQAAAAPAPQQAGVKLRLHAPSGLQCGCAGAAKLLQHPQHSTLE